MSRADGASTMNVCVFRFVLPTLRVPTKKTEGAVYKTSSTFHPDVALPSNTLMKTEPRRSHMELSAEKMSSQALLSCANGANLSEKFLLKPRAGKSLQTERVPRSTVLERLQCFLPQMAEANEKLKKQMEEAPAGHFDIERVEEAQRVIEMNVALVELSGSDTDSEDEEDSSNSEEDSDSDDEHEITELNLKLPGNKSKKKKANIQVLDQQGE